MTRSSAHTLIVGCGDTGVRVAARAVMAGERVTALVRSEASARRARSVGASARRCDLDHDDIAMFLPDTFDRLVYSAPPPREGDTDTRMAGLLAALPCQPTHSVYISTSGVYGDHDGRWIDETTPVAPTTARAKRRVDAERQNHSALARATVLRAPGIYGPGRLPIERITNGEPVLDDGDRGWTNRIHIDDLAAITWRAACEHWAHTLYNVSDGVPTRRGVYEDALAEQLGVATPPRIDWAEAEQRFSAMRLSFLRESRRLSNARLITDTGYRYIHADYRDGLEASLRGDPAISE